METITLRARSGTISCPVREARSLIFGRTADGTSVITDSADNRVRTYIMCASLDQISLLADRTQRQTAGPT
jgi:hypothetical protein